MAIPFIMAEHKNESFIHQAVHATTLRLCQAIRNSELIACDAVNGYLFQSEEHQVVSTMICALTAELATFVEGMSSLSCLRYALRSSAVNKLTRAKLVKSGTTAKWCSRTKPRCICGICSKCLRSN